MKESDLIKAISNYLKTVPNLFFWKEHGGMYGTAGIPDLIICYKGRFIGLECKVGKNTATALQQQTIRQILKAGGYAVVVKSVGEVKAIIQAFEKEYGRHQQRGDNGRGGIRLRGKTRTADAESRHKRGLRKLHRIQI